MEKIILHVITGLGRGGAERMLARLVLADRGLGAPRHIVVSLLNPGAYGEEIRQAGIELHCLRLNKFARLPIALARLVVLMRRSRPDVVMTWLYHADFIGILAAVMSGIGTRCVVWNLRCSNLDFSRYAWTTRWLARFLALLSPLPGAVATNSRSGQAAHAQMGYRPRCWFYLPNGLDLEKWSPEVIDRVAMRAELGITGKLVAVGMIARVDPQKDHSTFLAAVKLLAPRHPQARFILAGRNTEKLPASDGLLSLGERDDVQRVMRGLDLLVISSAYGEGCPNVLLEGMATGLPCVVTDVGDAADILEDTGLVVPPRNPEALAAAIDALLSEDLRTKVLRARRARELVRRKYSLQNSMDRYTSLWSHFSKPVRSYSRRNPWSAIEAEPANSSLAT